MRVTMIALALAGGGWSGMAAAQSDTRALTPRVDRLEREMRAVQRKVFPGGTPIEAQITAPPAGPVVAPGTPASGALSDLTERVASLEQQIANMTGQIEQTGYRTRQLEEAFNAYKAATDAKLRALEGGGGVAPIEGEPAGGVGGPATTATSIDRAPARAAVARPDRAPTQATMRTSDPTRVSAVAAVERPATGDAAEDTYTYGYRLWDAKLYPEAQAQLKAVAEKYPKHRRASFAQNLLGRAYLDDGKPALASVALYDSYKKWPDGERAPDSLFYLGQSLTRLKKPADACKVYDELNDVYATRMSASLRSQVTKGRADAKCGA